MCCQTATDNANYTQYNVLDRCGGLFSIFLTVKATHRPGSWFFTLSALKNSDPKN